MARIAPHALERSPSPAPARPLRAAARGVCPDCGRVHAGALPISPLWAPRARLEADISPMALLISPERHRIDPDESAVRKDRHQLKLKKAAARTRAPARPLPSGV